MIVRLYVLAVIQQQTNAWMIDTPNLFHWPMFPRVTEDDPLAQLRLLPSLDVHATFIDPIRSMGHTITRDYFKMKRTLTALTVAATMFASSASAFEPDDLQKLKDTGNCERCDLMGADLSGAFLYSANLFMANLFMANLNGANLEGSSLEGASLEGAELLGANLDSADLRNADLYGANLSGANLSGADMNGATLCNTIMPDNSVIYSGC